MVEVDVERRGVHVLDAALDRVEVEPKRLADELSVPKPQKVIKFIYKVFLKPRCALLR